MAAFKKSMSHQKGTVDAPTEKHRKPAPEGGQGSAGSASAQPQHERISAPEERFRLFVERVTDYAIFMLDPKGHVVTWNEGAERIKGYRAQEIVGQHMSRFYTPEDVHRGLPAQLLTLARADGRAEDEGWRIRKDGTRFWADAVITAIQNEKGELEGFGKVTRDLTERKQAEQALSDLAGRLVEAQDGERKRISLALNDSLSPSFVSLVSKLYQLKKLSNGQVSRLIDDSIALAESLSSEIRTVSYLLHPPSLEKDGLLATLHSYLDAFAKESGIVVGIDLPEYLARLPQAAEVSLYRIVHESLRGVLHSSGSSQAAVHLTADQGLLKLQVRAIGRGLPPGALDEIKKGVGELGVAIAGMRERMKRLSGHVEIDSNSVGAVVTATLPLNHRHPATSTDGGGDS